MVWLRDCPEALPEVYAGIARGQTSLAYWPQCSATAPCCGTHLIYAGAGRDSSRMYEVLKKCGEPEAKNGNNWIYAQGNMIRILTFNLEGRLGLIESERK